MCAYSFVADWALERLYPNSYPWYPNTYPDGTTPQSVPGSPPEIIPNTPLSRTDFTSKFKIEYVPSEEWKKQFLIELVSLLKKAKQYDIDNGEPDCELDSKKEKLKAIADELGVEINFP